MSSIELLRPTQTPVLTEFSAGAEIYPWYAIRTKSNQEKLSAAALASKGYSPFLPLYASRRQWSDRKVEISVPLFPGYVFCRFDPAHKLPVLTTPGVASIVGFANEPAAIPDSEVAAVEAILASGFTAGPCAFLHEGQRVRVVRGLLEGLEGFLLKKKAEWRLVISVEMLQRSIAVEVDENWVVPV